ncbi:mucin [Arthroderma uncinatum]|uniref:mucin n=1 Tax=Arthroderma uncinatum TaxID=74035 RepID=UPI00144A5D8F|nr:mucin [Arthroderma uncinatum]KAF3491505.1 mucin [Arthroderma uncinatum]
MGYNTRRKSLSLPSLGIHIPSGRRASTTRPATATSTITPTTPSQPPVKKLKRSHESAEGAETPAAAPDALLLSKEAARAASFHTPPPSPSAAASDQGQAQLKIDTEGIADDIVVAVIQQLEKTGNRPHLIKELAAVLSSTTESIANSANAAALISSRLSLYLKRPWTALAPCPIAKELIPVHPRKVFFYLTNCPHQPLPQNSHDIISPSIEKEITPSLSSVDIGIDDQDLDLDLDDVQTRDRSHLSPSPEVDLDMSIEFDQGLDQDHSADPTASFSMRQHSHAHGHRISHNHRAASPPLEGDEREFTLTASMVRERTTSDDGTAHHLRGLLMHNQLDDQQDSTLDLDMDSPYLDDHHTETTEEYTDYFSSKPISIPVSSANSSTDPGDTVYGTSPSPSIASEVSLASLTTATSDCCDSDEDVKPHAAHERALKRTYDMTLPGMELSQPRKPLSVDCTFSFKLDTALESWVDFRSPETVEVDELDAIFADI